MTDQATTDTTTKMPQFYSDVVLLTSEKHSDWSLERDKGYQFTAKSNSVYLSTVEFRKACAEYPIVFIGSEDSVMPAALLSVKPDQNSFLLEDGTWDAKYIPAYVRRYPFIPANVGEDQLLVGLDENCDGLNQHDQGERLYTDEGEQTAYTKNIVSFLRDFQIENTKTSLFCERLIDNNLLKPMEGKVKIENQDTILLKGFFIVDYAQLKKLKPNVLTKLLKSDDLDLIFSHLRSLDQFSKLAGNINKD